MSRLIKKINQSFRSLRRERFFTIVNLLGLSLGMFCFIVTSIYVTDELSHDKWHKNAENIYLPAATFNSDRGTIRMASPHAILDAWIEESPGVIDGVNISRAQSASYQTQGQEYETSLRYQTSSALFNVFDFGLKLGNEETALEDKNSVVISSELADKHFSGMNPLGQSIEMDNREFIVSGVLNPIPNNSHLQFDMLIPIDFSQGRYEGLEGNWNLGAGNHYILVNENYDLEKLKAETADIIQKFSGNKNAMTNYEFGRFSELYLTGRAMNGSGGSFGGQMKYVYIFSVIGVLMLIVASFNYVNLTTSRSFSKAKDLAVRKIIGASRRRLVLHQMGETLLISMVSLLLAMIAVEVAMPGIEGLIGKKLSFNLMASPKFVLIAVVILTSVVAASGFYPAFVGSKFNMVGLLKGQTPKSGGTIIRKSLIVFQFVICTGLLASALIIRYQAEYMINKDMGYNAQRVFNVDMTNGGMFEKYEALKTELQRSPLFEQVSGGPIPDAWGAMIFNVGEEGDKRNQFVSFASADAGIVDLFELEMISGKKFNQLKESEKENAVFLNEAALPLWDMTPETAIGSLIPDTPYRVTGVVKDFHFRSTKSEIGPLMIAYEPNQIRKLSFKFKEGNRDEVLSYADKVWSDLGATSAFEYAEVEKYFENAFQREESLIKIFDILTFMLVAVALLGLFALASFESQLKQKEMSIRKVLGANKLILVKSMNSKFAILILIALVISIPVTQYLISTWLDSFPYRIESTVPQYVIAGLLILLSAVVLLSFQGIKNARKNPVDILRND